MDRKQSYIGSYPSDWSLSVFETVAELKHGYQFRTHDFTDEGIKVFKITQIKDDGTIDISNCDFIEATRLESFKKFIIEKGDILMALSGATIGKIARFKSNEVVLQNYRVGNYIPLDEKVLSKDYFYYFLTTDYTYQQIIANLTQSAQENIGKEDIHKMVLFLPPLPEQIAIAEVLSSLDNKIDLLHRQNKTLEQLAETLFRQWFVEEAEENWEIGTIDDVVSMKGGTTPSTNESKFWDGNVHWTSPRDLSNTTSIFLFDTSRKITEEGLKQISSGLLPIGTLLLSSRAPIGYLALTEIPVAINQGYIAIICNKKVSNYYMYLWCKSNMETIENAGNGSVFQEISKSAFKTLEFQIPPKEKLSLFDEHVEPTFQKIKSNTIQIRTLTQLRDTLLPKLMSGEVKVNF